MDDFGKAIVGGIALIMAIMFLMAVLTSNRLESRLHIYQYDKTWCLAQEDMSEADCISFAGGD